jgi:hypothetical protein
MLVPPVISAHLPEFESRHCDGMWQYVTNMTAETIVSAETVVGDSINHSFIVLSLKFWQLSDGSSWQAVRRDRMTSRACQIRALYPSTFYIPITRSTPCRPCCKHVDRPIDPWSTGIFSRLQYSSQLMFALWWLHKTLSPKSDQALAGRYHHHLRQAFFLQPFGTMALRDGRHRVPDVKFRVLIIGRANAGKTSILKRVCDTTESPAIFRLGPGGARNEVCPRSW